jgi:hypothetical protein
MTQREIIILFGMFVERKEDEAPSAGWFCWTAIRSLNPSPVNDRYNILPHEK